MAERKSILFLCHRIPYPPDKGDKIRSYNLLLHLSRQYNVFLGTFVDSSTDWQHVSRLQQMCKRSKFVPLPRGARQAMSAGLAMLRKQALTTALYRSPELQEWVASVVADVKLSSVFIYSSAMGQYATHQVERAGQLLVDFVDVDSEKWLQYSQKRPWPLNRLFAREARLLASHDESLARRSTRSYFVSEAEAAVFRRQNPHLSHKIAVLRNGVDTEYFDCAVSHESPYPDIRPVVLFTGAMDYWPNVDAVDWFSNSVMPLLRQSLPDLVFYIVGSQPTRRVRRLATHDIIVTGAVADIRPYVANAEVVIAPLRVARGVQNKILEAMAMAKPVVTTRAGAEGIDAAHGTHLWIHDDEKSTADRIMQIVRAQEQTTGPAARDYVAENFTWSRNFRCLQEQLACSP